MPSETSIPITLQYDRSINQGFNAVVYGGGDDAGRASADAGGSLAGVCVDGYDVLNRPGRHADDCDGHHHGCEHAGGSLLRDYAGAYDFRSAAG